MAGESATTLTTTPTVHYHPHTATMTNFSDVSPSTDDRIKSMVDLKGLADAAGNSTTNAPILKVDALGRKYLCFRSGAYMTIANTLTGMNSRALTVFLVGRVHKAKDINFFHPRWTTVGATTAVTGRAGCMRTAQASSSAQYLHNADVAGSTAPSNKEKIIPGCQMQVIGMNALSGAGSSRLFINNDFATVAQAGNSFTDMTGAVINGVPGAAGAVTQQTTTGFDLYELVIVKGTVTNANAAVMAAELVSNWGISAVVRQLLLDGDSIVDGIEVRSDGQGNPVYSDLSLGMHLTKPGAMLVSDGTRVINHASSGSLTANLTTRRNATNSMSGCLLGSSEPEKNIFAFLVGFNDYAAGTSGDTHYSNVKTLLHTGSATGYLEKGWNVVAVCPTGIQNSTSQGRNVVYRNHLINDLLTDMTALSGGYASRVTHLDLHLLTVSGSTIVEDSTDAASLTYYQAASSNPAITDGTHPNSLATAYMASGGGTPQYGYGSILPNVVTGTISATEASDTASVAGDVLVQGVITSTEANDTAAIAGDVLVSGSLGASEGGDSAALAGEVLVQGALAGAEGSDTAALAGNVLAQGPVAASEASDSASFSGLVLITGAIIATEGSDSAAISGEVLVNGTLAATEATDTASFQGEAPDGIATGVFDATEGQDTAALSGAVTVSGALDATEAADSASFTSAVVPDVIVERWGDAREPHKRKPLSAAKFYLREAPDVARFVCELSSAAILQVREEADSISMNCTVSTIARLKMVMTERADTKAEDWTDYDNDFLLAA